jgi:uncharacterized protein with HEPN domain
MEDKSVGMYLYDILQSINAIESFLGERRNFFDYVNSRMLRSAIEREMEIIGEATKLALRLQPDLPITDAHKIISTRNNIAHNYKKVENTIIWAIIVNNLPTLKTEVEQLLKHT